jgi:hypothetical protein
MSSFPELNIPAGVFKIVQHERGYDIWDDFRKKYVLLTPEEWVRQHILWYLVNYLQYPQGRISVESSIKMNGLQRRCDAIVFDELLHPLVLIECKSYDVEISQETLMQISTYNRTLQVKYWLLTNGMKTYFLLRKNNPDEFIFQHELPLYPTL